MKARPQLTLAEMAARAAGTGRLTCQRCGCADFRTYKTIQGHVQTFRYKACRHCGFKFLTKQDAEQAIRSVENVREVVSDEGFEGDIV